MAKPKIPNRKKEYEKLNGRLSEYVKQVYKIYESLNLDAANAVSRVPYSGESDVPFRFSDYPITKKAITDIMTDYVGSMGYLIGRGTSVEWMNSNIAQDLIADKVLKAYNVTKNGETTRYYRDNSAALKAFQERADRGMNLSEKLWNQSKDYKEFLESAISCGIERGTSAVTLSKRISAYLNDYDSLKKDYREKYGKAIDIENCEYRSARLARSEINMAYRNAEQLRWQQMDFIVGKEIKLSNNHNCKGVPVGAFKDICDELAGKYPKDFNWSGWHPCCYSSDSQVLTNKGWRRFEDVGNNDLIYSLNPDTLETEWVSHIASQCYDYDGEMVRFRNRNIDCLVTLEHRMVYEHEGEIKGKPAFSYSCGDGFFIGDNRTFEKSFVAYKGKVYDLTLSRNHIMYIMRNGKCFWGSNCRCYQVPIFKTDEEFASLDDAESVNEVKDVPDNFKKWVVRNESRINKAEEKGTQPYFIRDNKDIVSTVFKDNELAVLKENAKQKISKVLDELSTKGYSSESAFPVAEIEQRIIDFASKNDVSVYGDYLYMSGKSLAHATRQSKQIAGLVVSKESLINFPDSMSGMDLFYDIETGNFTYTDYSNKFIINPAYKTKLNKKSTDLVCFITASKITDIFEFRMKKYIKI